MRGHFAAFDLVSLATKATEKANVKAKWLGTTYMRNLLYKDFEKEGATYWLGVLTSRQKLYV